MVGISKYAIVLAQLLWPLISPILKYLKVSPIHVPLLGGIFLAALVSIIISTKYSEEQPFIKTAKEIMTNKFFITLSLFTLVQSLTYYYGAVKLPISIFIPVFSFKAIALLLYLYFTGQTEVSTWQWVGMGVCMVGIFLITMRKSTSWSSGMLLAIGATVISFLTKAYQNSMFFTISKEMDEHKIIRDNPLEKSIYEISYITLPIIPYIILFIIAGHYLSKKGTVTGDMLKMPNMKTLLLFSLFAFVFLFGKVIAEAYSAATLDPTMYSAFLNIQIISALAVGYFINNEKVSYTNVFGVVVYLIGIYVVKKYHQTKKEIKKGVKKEIEDEVTNNNSNNSIEKFMFM